MRYREMAEMAWRPRLSPLGTSILLATVLLGSLLPVPAESETDYAGFPDLRGPYLGQTPPGKSARTQRAARAAAWGRSANTGLFG